MLVVSLASRRGMRRGLGAGIAAVEFAIVLPVLTLITFVIMDLALLMYNRAVLTHATREATRAVVMARKENFRRDQLAVEVRKWVLAYCGSQLVTLDTSNPDIQIAAKVNDADATGPARTQRGDNIRVTASYAFRGLLVGSAATPLVGQVVLTASSTMIHE